MGNQKKDWYTLLTQASDIASDLESTEKLFDTVFDNYFVPAKMDYFSKETEEQMKVQRLVAYYPLYRNVLEVAYNNLIKARKELESTLQEFSEMSGQVVNTNDLQEVIQRLTRAVRV